MVDSELVVTEELLVAAVAELCVEDDNSTVEYAVGSLLMHESRTI